MAYIVNTIETPKAIAATYTAQIGSHQSGDLILVFLTQETSTNAIGFASSSATITAAADTIGYTGSDVWTDGDEVVLTGSAAPGGTSFNTVYYVRDLDTTANTFKIAATSGGAAIDITSAGTSVTVTQVSCGSNSSYNGWRILVQGLNSARHAVAYIVASSSSETTPLFVGTNDDWLGGSIVVRDVSSTPFGSTPTIGTDYRSTTYSGTTYASGALTTAENGCLVLYSMAKVGGGAANWIRGKINDTRAAIKQTDSRICHTVSFVQQESSGAIPSVTFYNSNSQSGVGFVLAIRNASSGSLQPDIRPNVNEFRFYGVAGATHDTTVTWQAPDQFASSIGTYLGSAVNCTATAPTVGTTTTSGENKSSWGSFSSLSHSVNASLTEAASGVGIWCGGTHTATFPDLTGKLVSIDIYKSSTSGDSLTGELGVLVGFSDGTNWAVFECHKIIHGWTNGYSPPPFTVFIAPGKSTAFASSGSIDWTAVTRIGYFWHRISSSTAGYGITVRNLSIWGDAIPLTGGGSARPCNFADFYKRVTSWGIPGASYYQASSQVMVNQSLQIGDGGTNTTYFDGSASSIEYPLAWGLTTNDQVLWNVQGGSVALSVKAGASDTINLSAGVCSTDTEQALTIDSASSTSATYSFAGTSFVGWAPTWKTGVNVSSATFKECAEIDAKGSDWTDCSISETTSTDAAIAFSEDGGSMTRCTIDVTGTSAAYHLELGTATTAITLEDVTFTGTPTTDKIHVRKTTGTVTITTSGTTSIVAGDVTSEGATVSIVAPTLERGIAFSGLQTGTSIQVFTNGTQTKLFGDNSTAGSTFSFDDATAGSITVDYTIQKAGYLPIRVTGVVLTGAVGGQLDVSITQIPDRAYSASSGLTYGTTAVVTVGTNPTTNPGTKTFQLTTDSTGQNWYSFWIEQWIDKGNATGEALANVEFPLAANGPNSFTLNDGWTFSDGATSIAFLSRDGIRYLNTSDVLQKAWAAILTSGVPAGARVRYQQSDGGTTQSAVADGEMDELIQIYDVGVYDYRGYLVLKVQEQGYDQVESDVVALYGNLEDQLYVVGLQPLANGVATGDPGLTITITDHGATPVTWNGKDFSITITDNASPSTGTNLLRELRYNFETGGTYQGKDAFNWHDLIQTNGDDFKTVRGKVYGDTGASLKGVRVVKNDGSTAHPDFTLFTADDGTTYSPPVTANVSITGLVNAGAVPTRLQIINDTAVSASAWTANTPYATGDLVLRTSGIGTENTAGLYFRATTGGTSHAVTEPTWNTTPGGTTSDGTVTWTTYKVLFYDDDPAATSYTTTYIDGEEFLAGESVEVRFAEMNAGTTFKTAHSTAITATTGFTIAMTIESDSVYATNALDGSSYEATFSPNFTDDYIVLDSNTDFSGKSAYAYFCYTLTTSQGMYEFWDGVTALDAGNYRINTSTLNLYFDESAGFVKQTDDVRIFRDDGLRPALDPTTGGSGIEINWRVPVNVVTTGGSALTPTESAYLLALPSAADVSTQVLSDASSTPIASNIKQVNDVTVTGTGADNDTWGPA